MLPVRYDVALISPMHHNQPDSSKHDNYTARFSPPEWSVIPPAPNSKTEKNWWPIFEFRSYILRCARLFVLVEVFGIQNFGYVGHQVRQLPIQLDLLLVVLCFLGDRRELGGDMMTNSVWSRKRGRPGKMKKSLIVRRVRRDETAFLIVAKLLPSELLNPLPLWRW